MMICTLTKNSFRTKQQWVYCTVFLHSKRLLTYTYVHTWTVANHHYTVLIKQTWSNFKRYRMLCHIGHSWVLELMLVPTSKSCSGFPFNIGFCFIAMFSYSKHSSTGTPQLCQIKVYFMVTAYPLPLFVNLKILADAAFLPLPRQWIIGYQLM